MSKVTWTGLEGHDEIKESLLLCAQSLISNALDKEGHLGDNISGILTNVSILQIQAEKLKVIFAEQKKKDPA